MEENELLYILKVRILILLTFVLIASSASAFSYKDIVKQNQQQVDSHKHSYRPLVEDNKRAISRLEPEHRQVIKKAEQALKEHGHNVEVKESSILEEVVENIKNLESEEKKSKNKGILIFVSFSMPKDLLWSYQEQAKLYGARLVIKGLVSNDFKKTAQAMDLGDGKVMTLDVNPRLFRDYGIERVPSIVIAGDEGFASSEDKFIGTISLKYALEASSSNGQQKEFSIKKLNEVSYRGSK